MDGKTRVCFVAALLSLQFAGLSLASETSLQNIDNQPRADDGTAPSPLTEDNVSADVLEAELYDVLESSSPSVPEPQNEDDGLASAISEEDAEKSGRLIAQYTTKTKAVFATTTITALSTCFSATNTPCARRRRKRSMAPAKISKMDEPTDELAPSQEIASGEGEAEYEIKPEESDRKDRKFTIWTTLFSTHIITTTFYYPGTTVSISGVCSVPGLGSSCFG